MAVIVAVAVCALVGVLVEIPGLSPGAQGRAHVRLITAPGHEHLFGKPGMDAVWRQAAQRAGYFQPATITVGGVSLPLNVLLTIGIGVA